MPAKALTDADVRNAKPGEKPFRLYDSQGLYLEVSPSGGKWWRWKYRFAGKEKREALGVYPRVSLKAAREKRSEVATKLENGIDPAAIRKAAHVIKTDQGNTFEVVAREWLAKFSARWNEDYSTGVVRLFERDIFPWIGSDPISSIAAPKLLETIRRIEERGAVETAHRVLSKCGQVFRYAVATGKHTHDPSRDLKGSLPPVEGKHLASTTEPVKLAKILNALDGYEGTLTVRSALRLAPLVFVRPGELRKAEWTHFDLDAGEWRFVVTKTKTQHIVPLCRQAVEILREIHPLTGGGRFVFPGARSSKRPMSENAVLAAMRRMEVGKEEISGHGFRAAARTILDEVLGFRLTSSSIS